MFLPRDVWRTANVSISLGAVLWMCVFIQRVDRGGLDRTGQENPPCMGSVRLKATHVSQRRKTEVYRLYNPGLVDVCWLKLICHVVILAHVLPVIPFSVFSHNLKTKLLLQFQPGVDQNCASITADNAALTHRTFQPVSPSVWMLTSVGLMLASKPQSVNRRWNQLCGAARTLQTNHSILRDAPSDHSTDRSFCCCLGFEKFAFATPTHEPRRKKKKRNKRISGAECDLEVAGLVFVKVWLPYPGEAGRSPGSPPVVRSGLHHCRLPCEFETPGKLLQPITAQLYPSFSENFKFSEPLRIIR